MGDHRPVGIRKPRLDDLFGALKVRKGDVMTMAYNQDELVAPKTEDLWEWGSRHKGSARRAAAAEVTRLEDQRAAKRLSSSQRKLLATLDRFLSMSAVVPFNLLIADSLGSVRETIANLVEQAAVSNLHNGLPPLSISIFHASERADILNAMRNEDIHLALVSVALLDDYASCLERITQPLDGRGAATVYIVHDHTSSAVFDATQLYQIFGVQDQLVWPPTLTSMRHTLHKWMPRSGIAFPGSPLLGKRLSSESPPPALSPEITAPTAALLSPFRSSPLVSAHSSPPQPMLTSPTLYSPAARQPTVEMARDLTSVTQADTPLAPRLRHHPHGGGCAAALGCPLRVLVVSSCQVSAATLIHYCEVFTLWADYAADATEAMERLSALSQPYDLVVVDPDLAGDTSGYALCSWWQQQRAAVEHARRAHARSSGGIPPLPATTEFVCLAETPEPDMCATFGIKHCLAKPFSVRCFAAVLSKWLAPRR